MKYYVAAYDTDDKLLDTICSFGADARDAAVSTLWCLPNAVRVEWREDSTRQWAQTTLPFRLRRSDLN